MNIMELGAIGELVGGIAVLVTLVYLAFQVRQNRQSMRMGAVQASNMRAADFSSFVAGNSECLVGPKRSLFALFPDLFSTRV